MKRKSAGKLIGETELLDRLFSPSKRPSLRTLQRWRKDGKIPAVIIGRTPWFQEDKVRAALERKNHVRAL